MPANNDGVPELAVTMSVPFKGPRKWSEKERRGSPSPNLLRHDRVKFWEDPSTRPRVPTTDKRARVNAAEVDNRIGQPVGGAKKDTEPKSQPSRNKALVGVAVPQPAIWNECNPGERPRD